MLLSAIWAQDERGAIGSANGLPWYLPADLAYFKRTTRGHPVVMGRRTFESIGQPLPLRLNIVVTTKPPFHAEGVQVCNSLDAAIAKAEASETDEAFIIGGGQLYAAALSRCQKIYCTRIHTTATQADTFAPHIALNEWTLVSSETHEAEGKNEYSYTFEVYLRTQTNGV